MKKKYTKEEIEILMQNPNIKMIKYGNQIEYKDSFKKCRLAFICEFTTFISISLKNPFEFVYTLKEPSGECISVSTV